MIAARFRRGDSDNGIGLWYKGYDWVSEARQDGENITLDLLTLNDDRTEVESRAFQILDEEMKVWLDCTEDLGPMNSCTNVAKVDVPFLRDLLEGKV